MATCQTCRIEIVPGSRWCSVCRTSLLNPSAGRLAPPVKRLGAFVLDLFAPVLAWFLVFSAVGVGMATGSDAALGVSGLLSLALFFGYVVWSLLLFSRGETPGKHLLGIRVIREDGQSAGFLTMLVREWVGKWISGLIFSLGFLWILLDRDKQGWHDKLMSTYVVESLGVQPMVAAAVR